MVLSLVQKSGLFERAHGRLNRGEKFTRVNECFRRSVIPPKGAVVAGGKYALAQFLECGLDSTPGSHGLTPMKRKASGKKFSGKNLR